MVLYFAGVPGGTQIEREKDLSDIMTIDRLVSFFYFEQMMTTLVYYKRIDNGET